MGGRSGWFQKKVLEMVLQLVLKVCCSQSVPQEIINLPNKEYGGSHQSHSFACEFPRRSAHQPDCL
jgi:hypothetical protein